MRIKAGLAAIIGVLACFPVRAPASSEAGLTVKQLVEVALEANPQVKGARARWLSAEHSIKQNYAPADPLFGYDNVDSPTNGFSQASAHTLTVTDSFQFPGKAFLQADQAKQSAAIARISYNAVMRDIRASIETAYYQALLDGAQATVQAQTIANLEQVLKVAQTEYAVSQVTQTDFIRAEFDVATARLQERQLTMSELNDETAINQLLYRAPEEPLNLDRKLGLVALQVPLDELIDRATAARQEILEAALAQNNRETALTLAKLEYAPDYTLGYTFDNYLLSSAAPGGERPHAGQWLLDHFQYSGVFLAQAERRRQESRLMISRPHMTTSVQSAARRQPP